MCGYRQWNGEEDFTGVDASRGIAAIAVVMYHFSCRYDELYGHPGMMPFWVPFGDLGVPLFFMISGFVILMTLRRTETLGQFAAMRLGRLYPAFWVAVMITFVVAKVVHLPDGTAGIPTKDVLWNFTMVHKFIGAYQDVDGVYWTLEKEMFFYALMAGVFVLKLQKQVIRFWRGWRFWELQESYIGWIDCRDIERWAGR